MREVLRRVCAIFENAGVAQWLEPAVDNRAMQVQVLTLAPRVMSDTLRVTYGKTHHASRITSHASRLTLLAGSVCWACSLADKASVF
jgi:hypothetical protein